jgi:hypothetical protein
MFNSKFGWGSQLEIDDRGNVGYWSKKKNITSHRMGASYTVGAESLFPAGKALLERDVEHPTSF